MYICGSCFSQIDDRAITNHDNAKCFNKRCFNNGHKLFYADDSIANIVSMLMRAEFMIDFNSLKGFAINSLKGNITSIEVPFITIESEYSDRMDKFIELIIAEGGEDILIPVDSLSNNAYKQASDNKYAYRLVNGYNSKYAQVSLTSNPEAFRKFIGTTTMRTVKNQTFVADEYRRFGEFMSIMHMATTKYHEYRNECIIAKREELRAQHKKENVSSAQ